MDVNPSSTSDDNHISSKTEEREHRLQEKATAKDSAKDLKYREEWEQEKKVVTVKELRAWYWYDFAMSGYPSCKYLESGFITIIHTFL